jgi:membrane-associated phospholipid phosphatase
VKKTTQLYIIIIILAILSIAFSLYVWRSNRFSWELSLITHWQSYDNHSLNWIMEKVSYLCTGWRSPVIVICSGLLFVWRTGIVEGCLMALTGIVIPINFLIKLAINQTRPDSPLIRIVDPATDSSYPSGHAFFATVVLGMIAFLLFTTLRKKLWRILSLIVIIFLILLVGTSRIYLGDHWPSDVIGAYLIGGFFLSCLILFYFRIKALI